MYGDSKHEMVTNKELAIVNGETYDVEFGMYDISDKAVRIIMMVDGKTMFNEVVEDTAFVSAKSYFCVTTSSGGVDVVLGAVEVGSGGESGGETDGDVSDGDVSDEVIEVYVALVGSDTNAGTIDAPVKTLEGARDLVRKLKAERIEAGDTSQIAATIYLRGGEYALSETFALTAVDSGTKAAPVVWRAYEGEEVVITGTGSYDFSKFQPVTGDMKAKLPAAAQDHVVVASATDLGLTPIEIGVKERCRIVAPIIRLDDKVMNLTRYPNAAAPSEWISLTGVNPSTTRDYVTVQIDDDLVWSWDYNTNDFIYSSYLTYNWYNDAFFGSRDTTNKQVTSLDLATYGCRSGERPLRIFNAFQSIDEPGEWYYDGETDMLYMYPYDGATAESKVYVTECDFNLISITGAAYVSIEGMTITSSDANGVVMDGASNCTVNNCKLLGFCGQAVSINATTTYSGVKNSEIAYTGNTAVSLNGGDIATSTVGNNFVSGNKIHDTTMYKTQDVASVVVRGVKNTVNQNEFYNIPAVAVNVSRTPADAYSVDAVIDQNIFHDCNIHGQEHGVINGGSNASNKGIVIRNNHFYDIGGAMSNNGTVGNPIYFRSDISGATATGNTFE